MKKELVCVICPNGCFLEADVVQGESGTEVRQVAVSYTHLTLPTN